jgi:hypothetical protein
MAGQGLADEVMDAVETHQSNQNDRRQQPRERQSGIIQADE